MDNLDRFIFSSDNFLNNYNNIQSKKLLSQLNGNINATEWFKRFTCNNSKEKEYMEREMNEMEMELQGIIEGKKKKNSYPTTVNGKGELSLSSLFRDCTVKHTTTLLKQHEEEEISVTSSVDCKVEEYLKLLKELRIMEVKREQVEVVVSKENLVKKKNNKNDDVINLVGKSNATTESSSTSSSPAALAPPPPPVEKKRSDFITAKDYAGLQSNNNNLKKKKKLIREDSMDCDSDDKKEKFKRKKFQPPFKNKENKEGDELMKKIHKRVFPNSKHNDTTTTATSAADQKDDGSKMDERLKVLDPKLVEVIESEIMDQGIPVKWDDIAGLEHAKKSIQEAVIWPLKRPDIFKGLRRAPKGILLFGPPGTGKTMIGKCIAHTAGCTFFSISASSLTSKWVGEGEKLVKALFLVARIHAPSVIFIDEIDSLLSQRQDGEFESSRRIKTEFLIQFDGAHVTDEETVLLIGATNRPQEIDEAARRRMIKRYYIPLPNENARKYMFSNLLKQQSNAVEEEEIDELVKLTEGYSGSDIAGLCAEASLGPVREIPPNLIDNITVDDVRPVKMCDFLYALKQVKKSVSERDLELYENWNKDFGSVA